MRAQGAPMNQAYTEGQIPSDAKGKPLARAGRKATDLIHEDAGLP